MEEVENICLKNLETIQCTYKSKCVSFFQLWNSNGIISNSLWLVYIFSKYIFKIHLHKTKENQPGKVLKRPLKTDNYSKSLLHEL